MIDTLDRMCDALFSRHVERDQYAVDRAAYRRTALDTGFERFLVRLYGVAWLCGLCFGALVGTIGLTVGRPLTRQLGVALVVGPQLGTVFLVLAGIGFGVAGGRMLGFWAGRQYLDWRGAVRRRAIERTLPGAIRSMHVLAQGDLSDRDLLAAVAQDTETFGETAVALRRVCTTASLAGSLEAGLARVAQETPSQERLAHFLLAFREQAGRGRESLVAFLEAERNRVDRRSIRREQATLRRVRLVLGLFVCGIGLLILSAVWVVTGEIFSGSLGTAIGQVEVRTVSLTGIIGGILGLGLICFFGITCLHPATVRNRSSQSGLARIRSAPRVPINAAVLCLPLAPIGFGAALLSGSDVVSAGLLGYAAASIPIGLVALRRSRIDSVMDARLSQFIPALAHQVSMGRPLSAAVDRVSQDMDWGPLESAVNRLGVSLSLTDREKPVQVAALNAFRTEIGTKEAETIDLLTAGVRSGAPLDRSMAAVQSEMDRHQSLSVMTRRSHHLTAAVGWAIALALLGLVVGVTHLDIGPVTAPPGGQNAYQIYLIVQGCMLVCGWFAGGVFSRHCVGLLHSSILVIVGYIVFLGLGIL